SSSLALFFFSSRRRHTRFSRDWSSDVCSSDLTALGDRVEVYLDGGPSRGGVASTIIDATGPTLRIVRAGALSLDELTAVVPEITDVERPASDDDGAKDGAVGP